MSTHNIGFYKDLAKLSSNTHLIASSGGCKNMHDHVIDFMYFMYSACKLK